MSGRRLAVVALLMAAGYVAVGWAALSMADGWPDSVYLSILVAAIMAGALAAGRRRQSPRHGHKRRQWR